MRSFWSMVQSSVQETHLNSVQSSANSLHSILRLSPNLFTYSRKSSGPSMGPCGKPEVTPDQADSGH